MIGPGNATTDPTVDPNYDGTAANSNIFSSTPSTLDVNQSITVEIVVEIDPDNAGATFDSVSGDGSGDFENQATVTGVDPGGSGGSISDDSDDPTDADTTSNDTDNDPDSPTAIVFPDITLVKTQVGSIIPATSNIAGNFEVTYDLAITNTGGEALHSLSLIEDLQANYGGAFVRIVPQGVTMDAATIQSAPVSDDPELNVNYDGTTGVNSQLFDNSGANSNELGIGETVVVRIVIEIDPDDPAANLTNGLLENQASTEGTGAVSNTTADDLSDDPSDLTDDGNADNNPDDPNAISFADIDLTKIISGAPTPAASGTMGNFDVVYSFEVRNTGTEILSNLSLTDDLATEFGPAFQGVVDIVVAPGTASGAPTANTAANNPVSPYDGSAGSDILLGNSSDELRPGESFFVTLTVEIDPDAAGAVYNAAGELENSASVAGDGENGGTATDVSDDTTNSADVQDPTDIDNDGDDPTVLTLSAIALDKTAGTVIPAADGTSGQYDVTYTFVATNIGNDDLTNFTLTDDWTTQFGGAFVGIVDVDLSDDVTVPGGSGIRGNNNYTGGALENLLDGNGTLATGETITVVVTVRVEPTNATAVLVDGTLQNNAEVSALDSNNNPVNDVSDDPTDGDDIDPNADNNPDSPTNVSFANIEVEKIISTTTPPAPASSGTAGNFDVTYEFLVTNTGTETLSNLSLTDDLDTQFGTAFVDVVSVAVSNIDAINPPSPNGGVGGYNGTAFTDMLLGSAADVLESGQQFRVVLVVEIDPDAAGAVYNADGELENSAIAAGDGENGGSATDVSDDTTDGANIQDPTDVDNDPDDPTVLLLPQLEVTKTAGTIVPASGGTAGNFDVTYDFTVTNLSLIHI